jgi:hypothetical protein
MTARRLTLRLGALALLSTIGASAQAPNYAAIRAENAKELTQPYGWFSLISLESILPGSTTVGSAKDNKLVIADAPAHLLTLSAKDGVVTVASADPCLKFQGKPVPAGFVVTRYVFRTSPWPATRCASGLSSAGVSVTCAPRTPTLRLCCTSTASVGTHPTRTCV